MPTKPINKTSTVEAVDETPKQKWNRLADDARRQVDESGFSDDEIKERLDKLRTSDWEVIWESMSPIERGQFNAQKRKQGEPIYVQKKNIWKK